MSREEMIEKAARAIATSQYGESVLDIEAARTTWIAAATCALDAILPQVTTVEELKAVRIGSVLMTEGGHCFRWDAPRKVSMVLKVYGPLTVVWQP